MIAEVTSYIQRGWRPIPIPHRQKRPMGLKWQDTAISLPDVHHHFRDTPPHNVGILLGTTSHLVDIDLDHAKALELADQFLPPTATFGRPGKPRSHRIYHVANPAPSKRFQTPDRICIVEYRATGGQTVFPPSVHPSGETIAWDGPIQPIQMDGYELMDEVEKLYQAVLASLSPAPTRRNLNFTALPLSALAPPPPPSHLSRCLAYLETLPEAISGQGGHTATFHAACEIARFDLDSSDSWEAINWFNNHKCIPPWTEKELRHKLAQGRKKVGESGDIGKHLYEPAIGVDFPPPSSPSTAKPDMPASPIPPHLLTPPGFVGELCAWMNATAYKPQPVLSLANALAFFGAVVGRKVRTPSDLRTNIYCMGVGVSGCGKDHSRKCIKRICHAAGLTDKLLGGEDLSSDTAILSAVASRYSLIFQLDEIGHLFANIKSFGAAPHLRAIPSTFTKLFSSANTLFLGKEYAAGERKDIPQPNVCLYGTTVPSKLYDNLTPDEIRDGFLGRMLVFQTFEDDPDESETPPNPEIPSRLVETIQCWYSRKVANPAAGNIAAITENDPMVVPVDSEGLDEMKRFRSLCREQKARYRDESGFDALWARGPEHAEKVALVVAAGADYGNPVITGDIARWAVGVVTHCLNNLIHAASRNVASSPYQRNMQRMWRIIEAAGANGVRRSDLTKKMDSIDGRMRRSILDDLLEGGRVLKRIQSTGGRSVEIFAPAE